MRAHARVLSYSANDLIADDNRAKRQEICSPNQGLEFGARTGLNGRAGASRTRRESFAIISWKSVTARRRAVEPGNFGASGQRAFVDGADVI